MMIDPSTVRDVLAYGNKHGNLLTNEKQVNLKYTVVKSLNNSKQFLFYCSFTKCKKHPSTVTTVYKQVLLLLFEKSHKQGRPSGGSSETGLILILITGSNGFSFTGFNS